MVDPGELTYRDLAEMLRRKIHDGTLPSGARMPSEAELRRTHGAGRELVRRAMRDLRHEGLIVVVRGSGYHVREAGEQDIVRLQRGSTLRVRMPTPVEKRELGIGDGVPVAVVTDPAGRTRLLPGDRYRFTFR